MPSGNPSGEVSQYRLILQENKAKPFGSLINEQALLAVLEPLGSVWGLVMVREGNLCHVTFRQPEVVTKLVTQGSLEVCGLTINVKPSYFQVGMPVRAPPARAQSFFSAASARACARSAA